MKDQLLTIISLLLISFFSCEGENNQFKKSADGVWMQSGYGKIFEIRNDSVKVYDICKAGCQIYEHVPLISKGIIESFTKDSMTLRKNIKTYKFVKLKELPNTCSYFKANSNDPEYNFEILWNTFNEQYCFFQERNVNWTEIYNIHKKRISEETSELELYQIFDDILKSINDGHVQLEVPESLEDTISVLVKSKDTTDSEKAQVNKFELADKIANKYCKEIKSHNAGIVKWGMMKNKIAYVQINAMWLLAYYDLPKDLPLNEFGSLYGKEMDKRTFQRQDEIDGANLLMDTIINEINIANALIIDLRFNTGGKDEVGLEFIGHLVDRKTKIASKKARLESGFTNHQDIFLEPRNPNFTKSIYILTSHLTSSAAEIAVLATLLNGRFMRIGSNTEGVFSDGLDKRLPNGWDFTLSNEIYEDLEGNNYEGIGIRPDVDLQYPKDQGAFINLILDQLYTSGDAAIEEVFRIENENK